MFSLAKKLAAKSQHKQHHHSVVITKGGAIVAQGFNHKFKHAEVDALNKLDAFRVKLRGKYTLWSFRWRKNGTWGLALPCWRCMQDIGFCGIAKVYYTNEQGKLVRL